MALIKTWQTLLKYFVCLGLMFFATQAFACTKSEFDRTWRSTIQRSLAEFKTSDNVFTESKITLVLIDRLRNETRSCLNGATDSEFRDDIHSARTSLNELEKLIVEGLQMRGATISDVTKVIVDKDFDHLSLLKVYLQGKVSDYQIDQHADEVRTAFENIVLSLVKATSPN